MSTEDYAGWSQHDRPDVWDDYARLEAEEWDEHVRARREDAEDRRDESLHSQLCGGGCGRMGSRIYGWFCLSCFEQRRAEREQAA